MSQFRSDVSKFVRSCDVRMEGAFKESVQRVIDQAEKPRAKGGNMPVDTGYLRNSGMAEIGRLPSGEPSKGNQAESTLKIAKAKPGETIYYGWTAAYARAMEHRYGFMRLAVSQWQRIVKEVAAEMKMRTK